MQSKYQYGVGRRKDGSQNRVRRCVAANLSDDGEQLLAFRGWFRQETMRLHWTHLCSPSAGTAVQHDTREVRGGLGAVVSCVATDFRTIQGRWSVDLSLENSLIGVGI